MTSVANGSGIAEGGDMKIRHLFCLVLGVLLFCPIFVEASDHSDTTVTMQLIQVAGGEEYVASANVKIGSGNSMIIEMPGRENITVEFTRKAGGIIKFAVSEIEMGKLRTMHFIGTGVEDGKLVGDIIFIEDGKLQDDISGRFLLDDVFDW
jgi:hypothetical protein